MFSPGHAGANAYARVGVETAVMGALKGLPAAIVERERSLAVRLVALARQKARNEIKNWQPLAG